MNHSKKPLFKSAMDFNGRPLAMCLEKIAEQKQLLNRVRNSLPADIAEHAIHCVLSNTRLLVYTDSAVWASQIRFFNQEIVKSLPANGRQTIVSVQVKILLTPTSSTSRRTKCLPSAKTIDDILGRVDDKSNDALDLALAKLGRTLKKRLADKTA
ncbi:DciA family protein [Methylomonas methanica]|uniref:Uncharacterized protein n=1 Tax=Methylomonas methanica (strain DSM 25384 / MC09) TaxID=857087 RepID=F9ZZP1_METMM|nr:DciA family protein [Methylomonas methanica]AEF98700.1 protein of unknown function DUF721 [Methylomonas methanica MC09]